MEVGDIRLPADRLNISVNETSLARRQSGLLGSTHPCHLGLPAAQTARGVARRRRALLGNDCRCALSNVDTWRSRRLASDSTDRLSVTGCPLSQPVPQAVRLCSAGLRRQGLDFDRSMSDLLWSHLIQWEHYALYTVTVHCTMHINQRREFAKRQHSTRD